MIYYGVVNLSKNEMITAFKDKSKAVAVKLKCEKDMVLDEFDLVVIPQCVIDVINQDLLKEV